MARDTNSTLLGFLAFSLYLIYTSYGFCVNRSWHVHIINGIANDSLLINPKSGNDDLGIHVLQPNQAYTWHFCEKFAGTRKSLFEKQTEADRLVVSCWDDLKGVHVTTANFDHQGTNKLRNGILIIVRTAKPIKETTDKIKMIQEKLKAARDRQKSYADNRRKPLEFQVGDKVLLKVSPWKGLLRFGKKGKLNLPPELSAIHDTFHVSNLKKCLSEETVVLPLEEVQINEQLRITEEPIEILDREIEQLRRSKFVKKLMQKLIYRRNHREPINRCILNWR
ncbi:hypothetical protein OSB04_010913 [Centaurea solstitialis]|uniref:Reverse transcriptase domain-containing protein n=1 Tax=Centaurea solstitialis TaxID=347529 RepID=A0AA38TA59_9ASTR|nr:hypothetical protein OSB04_010913 [Centaurea solstitialis]